MKLLWAAFAIAALLMPARPALAEEPDEGKSADSLLVRVRGLGIMPDTSSSISAIHGQVHVSDTVAPEVDASYFLTDGFAIETIVTTTRHRVVARGTVLGDVDAGTVRLLAPTVIAQWHFMPHAAFSPYVGAGATYSWFFDPAAPGGLVNKIAYSRALGGAIEAGADYNVTGRWFLNFDVKRLFFQTTVKIDGGAIRAETNVRPTIVGAGIGYRF
ncbi:MAG TPA: OmpW family outer membrane protein [Aliidongia sp.]|uniref:OmpW/AlkL family protein n=1 Tax=Aliidongia sp. TaxID=1914230 RepID=UPI002DDDAD3C|nr:OmpW family outer membrane protein [Aliidongia sp.]HEV2676403.1 OmpW family outer membrane protein [Aliidongia sp.]